MTEYDRGAYTPQYDEELAFDPRHPRGKRPLPLTLIASAAVLVVLVGAVALAYRSGVRSPGAAPHTVGKPVLSVKSAPGPDAQAQDDTVNMDVYDAQTQARAPAPPPQAAPEAASALNTTGAEAAASAPAPAAVPAGPPPAFAPPPEEPVLRPHPKVIRAAPVARAHAEDDEPATGNMTPTADGGWKLTAPAKTSKSAVAKTNGHARSVKAATVETPRTTAAKTAVVSDKPVKTHTETSKATKLAANEAKAPSATRTAETDDEAGVEAASTKKPAAKTTAKSTAAADKGGSKTSSESKAVKTAADEGETADAKPTAAMHGKFMVQIGAFASSALADKGYAAVAGVLPGQMSGKGKHVEPVDHNGKTLYRTTVTGFASRADAVSFCEALKAKGKICFVKG